MFSKFEFIIALNYLYPRGASGFIALFSLFGIMLGVSTLTITTAIMNGFRTELINSIINTHGHVNIYGKLDQKIINTIKENKYVTKVVPSIGGQTLISSEYNSTGAIVRGVELESIDNVMKNIVSGNLNDFNNGVLIGNRLADNLSVEVGDQINLFSARSVKTFIGDIPKIKTYTVAGVFSLGMFEYDNVLLYMQADMARKFFNYDERFFNIANIYIKDPEIADIFAQKIVMDLGINADSWKDRGSLLDALNMEKSVMFFILTMIIVVASFNIISSLTILVQNKRRDIAILRTIGATRFNIMKIFIICGSSVGVIGTILGLILGIAFAYNIEEIKLLFEQFSNVKLFSPIIYFFDRVPSVIVVVDIVKISFISLSLSFLATILPAIKAAKEDPAKIIREE